MSFKSNNDNALLYQQSLQSHFSVIKADTIYVLKCPDIELPTKIGKYTIIDISNNVNNFLNNTSSLYVIKLMPIEINKGTIEIALVDYIFKNNSGEIIMSNAGSVVYSYKYESQSKKYRLVRKIENTL